MVLLLLSTLSIPVMGAGGNGGSSGSDGAGSAGSGGNGSGGDSGGNAGNGAGTSSGPEGPQAQPLQEEQERKQQETVEQPGVQITQQDRDQAQGRTGVDTTVETSPDTIRQRDRDLFLQQINQQEQDLLQVQDREKAQLDIALYTFSVSGNVTGSAGPELARLAGEINNSLTASYQAEQRIETRSSFTRMLFGGDQDAAGLLIQYADQNQQRIQQMEQLVANCSDCDPQVRATLQEQLQVLAQEQNRLLVTGQQEQGERGFFGWLFGGSSLLPGTGQAAPLTDDEKYWMTYMREEEKLARDVYLSLGTLWNLPIFTNIAQSEQTHMDSVKTLLDRYSIPDPAAGKAQGEFTNPDLQKLHDDLITQGSVSPVEALKVGVFIEKTDIEDLNVAIATAQHNDIKTVYSNLLQGSLNHLNAFETDMAKY